MVDSPLEFPIMLPGYGSDTKELLGRVSGPIYTRVPWAMLAPHETQARNNHSQTLKRLAERGGLAPCEAVAVLEDREHRRMTDSAAYARLAEHVAAWQRRPDIERLATLEGAAAEMLADHMTSENHHPGYVLVPVAAFERLRR